MECYVLHVIKECNSNCKYCLTENTQITMSDFKTKSIKDITIGDFVLGFNEKRTSDRYRKVEQSKVIQTFKRESEVYKVLFDDGTFLEITNGHPLLVYRSTDGNLWKSIKEIKKYNNYIASFKHPNFYLSKIVSIEKMGIRTVYNLETETNTYIANGKCVHNCYEQDKTSTYRWEEIKEYIDNLTKYNKFFKLEFLGGEPLLAFDHIQNTVEYLEDNSNIQVHEYTITTNGTILNDEIVKFLKNNPKVRFAASMDGTKFANQLRVFKNGHNTHDTVVKNLKTLLEEIGPNRVSVHMVTHPYNIALLSKGIDHLYNIGIRSIGVGTIESTITIGKEYVDRFIREMDIVSERICNGEYPGLHVGELESLKPKTDRRHYIYDETGKTVGESYGRADNDITKQETKYKPTEVSSPLGNLIYYMREKVYLNHQNRKK